MIQSSDGGYVIAGRTKADNLADDMLWLLKTDSEGNLEWDNISSAMSRGHGVVETSDGGFIIVGPGGVILKANSAGRFEGDVGVVRTKSYSGAYSINQTSRFVTVSYPAIKSASGASLTLLDLKGAELERVPFSQGQAVWSAPSNLSGVIVIRFNLGEKSFSDRFHLLN